MNETRTTARVAVIGSGSIGRTLARRLAASGADVTMGLRDAGSASAAALAAELPGVPSAPVERAIGTADVVVVAIPGANLESFVADQGAAIGGRVVLDTTNDLAGATLNGMGFWRRDAADARVFRAFCSSGWESFADPLFDGLRADVFYCGPDGDGRAVADDVIGAVGVRPVWLGDEDAADLLDSLARIWFQLAFQQQRGRNIAFKLLER
jgi:predicted dinucleotide-binding enzyme